LLGQYNEKPFCSVSSDDLGLESDDEKAEADKAEAENKELLDFVKDRWANRIAAARISHKLVSKPVCLTTQGEITLEMERYFANIRRDGVEPMKAQRVLELNATHPHFCRPEKRLCRRPGSGGENMRSCSTARRCS
jgi:molecular chaperone HtpG